MMATASLLETRAESLESRASGKPALQNRRTGLIAGAVLWFAAGCLVRGLFLPRIEGIFDHDQAVVGLMSYDISRGERWPIFFDGQRYMGAIEAYVAAGFVRLFGFTPSTVALAPLFFCGLFVCGQFVLWTRWSSRAAGHLAASIALIGAPMATIWTLIPRGGYVEFLCWCLPVLYVYRRACARRGANRLPTAQFGWGLLLGLGFFVNPLSIVIYATLALDWTFGRHGASIRQDRGLDASEFDKLISGRWSVLAWALMSVFVYCVLAFSCKVRLGEGAAFVFVGGLLPDRVGKFIGIALLVAVLGILGWLTGATRRVVQALTTHLAFCLGVGVAMLPFVAFQIRSRLGLEPKHSSLPMWLRDPATVWMNIRDLGRAIGPFVGCDVGSAALMYEHWPETFPASKWPALDSMLGIVSVVVVLLVACLIGRTVWLDRSRWRKWLAMRRAAPATPSMLCTLGLGVACALYLVQATSPDGSSTRYLMPVWAFLPGVLATAILSLKRFRWPAFLILIAAWASAQMALWNNLGREHPWRPLARVLDDRGFDLIVAPQHVGLVVCEFTQARVGFLEYQPYWGRVHDRYLSRARANEPLICVAEARNRGLPQENLAARMRALAQARPGTTRLLETFEGFEIWQTSVPRSMLCGQGRIAQATQ